MRQSRREPSRHAPDGAGTPSVLLLVPWNSPGSGETSFVSRCVPVWQAPVPPRCLRGVPSHHDWTAQGPVHPSGRGPLHPGAGPSSAAEMSKALADGLHDRGAEVRRIADLLDEDLRQPLVVGRV